MSTHYFSSVAPVLPDSDPIVSGIGLAWLGYLDTSKGFPVPDPDCNLCEVFAKLTAKINVCTFIV